MFGWDDGRAIVMFLTLVCVTSFVPVSFVVGVEG